MCRLPIWQDSRRYRQLLWQQHQQICQVQTDRSKAAKVKATLVGECFTNFECRLADGRQIDKFNFFILEIVKAYIASTPCYLKTLHYHGRAMFTVSCKSLNL
jgi:flavin reductase (DIM6/NTAB) family NADH-FMN oxidoreductase RutF